MENEQLQTSENSATAENAENEKILHIENVTKKYGFKTALDGVSLDIAPGRILGLMGPNGSGKTTLLKIIAGLQHQMSGVVEICGIPAGTPAAKNIISFLPDRNVMFKKLTAEKAIDFYEAYFSDFSKEKAYQLLDFMKLGKDEKIAAMSKGMIEKLNLVLTFARQSKLYVLDEPLGGVDPVTRERVVSTIINTYNPDSSIIISTHLVNDIESIFKDVYFIGRGKVILSGSAEELREKEGLSIDKLYVKLFSDFE